MLPPPDPIWPPKPAKTPEVSKTLWKGIRELTQSEDLADFEVECQGRSWKINSFLISAQSPFFKRLCLSDFREGKERKVTLDDDDLRAVEAMMQFLCSLSYTVPRDENYLLVHAKVYTLADKYDISDLKNYVVQRCTVESRSYPTINEQIDALVEATTEAYASSPLDDQLRHVLRKTWCTSSGSLILLRVILKTELDLMIENAPGFGSDILYYTETSDWLLQLEGWSVTASRVYLYLDRYFADHSGRLYVKDIAAQLRISEGHSGYGL